MGAGEGLRREQGNDVRVGDLCLCHMQVLTDRVGQLYAPSYQSCSCLKGSETTYQWRKGIPRQEGHHEPQPREEKDSSIFVERVEDRDGLGLSITWVDLWRDKEKFDVIHRQGINQIDGIPQDSEEIRYRSSRYAQRRGIKTKKTPPGRDKCEQTNGRLGPGGSAMGPGSLI